MTAGDPAVCPLCGGTAAIAFTAVDRNREITAQPFRYRCCQGCGAYSLVDVPDDLGPFYPSAYYELPDPAALDALAPVEQHKVDRVRRWATGGRLVEVGPGVGVFAHGARKAGFDVTVVEMDERACTFLRDVVGAEAVHSDDPAAALRTLPPSRAIALWHVIEHLRDPWALLEAAAENLEPGGVLVLATPNPDSLQFRLLKERWAHVDAPRHLFLLPLATLADRCAELGMEQVEVTTSDPAGRHWNSFGWEYAMRRRPAAGPAPKALAVGAVALSVALRPVEHTGLRGAAYTVVFKKGDA